MVYLIKFDIEIPYWVTFRVPTVINFIVSYSVPPFTTIYGMIMNALGKNQDDFSYYNKIKIAIEVVEFGERIWDTLSYMKTADPKKAVIKKSEIVKILKDNNQELKDKKIQELVEKYNLLEKEARTLIDEGNAVSDVDFRGVFYTQSLQCERLINPKYRIYINLEDKIFSDELFSALKNPVNPLYLGQSDDMVIIQNIEVIENPQIQKLNKVSTIFNGILTDTELLYLPQFFDRSGRTINCIKAPYSVFKGIKELKDLKEGYQIQNSYIIF